MILAPRPATWQRWRALSGTRYSMLRGLEYERLAGLRLAGRTLDVGGGARSSYNHLLEIDGRLDSVNIDPGVRPTLVADLNAPLPLATASYDNAISLNTLEHIRDDTLAIREMVRVLRPGGGLHLVVPFLYYVHASPGDYHRHSAYWWREYLSAQGIDAATLVVEPLLWDALSSAFSLVEYRFGRFRGIPKRLVMLVAVVHQRLSRRGRPPAPDGTRGEHALGYYIHGSKR